MKSALLVCAKKLAPRLDPMVSIENWFLDTPVASAVALMNSLISSSSSGVMSVVTDTATWLPASSRLLVSMSWLGYSALSVCASASVSMSSAGIVMSSPPLSETPLLMKSPVVANFAPILMIAMSSIANGMRSSFLYWVS